MTEEDVAAVERLRAARADPPAVETEQALARLESTLFGAPPRTRVLDRYPLIRKLGQGGAGVVYLAYDPRLDRKVAIKLLHPSHSSGRAAHGTSEGRARLMREAQAMARSPHPNVVAVYDVGTYPGTAVGDQPGVFLVMEYVEGADLQAWLRTSRPWQETLGAFVQAARGLAAAHRVGVTHRDFKPANAIVGDDGRVRVLDFGLARGAGRDDEGAHWDATDPSAPEIDAPLTAEGTVLGTPAFMAPEQHEHATSDAAGDQYGFCVALWEGLFGARPFHGASLQALMEAKLAGPPAPPARPPIPGFLVDVMRRGLEPDPRARFPSMDALLAAIERGLARRRRRAGWLLAGLAVPLVLGGWAMARTPPATCTGAGDRIGEIWSATRREEIEAAFTATSLPYASASASAVLGRLDDFARGWAEGHEDACVATRVTAEQSETVMDLRMACLDRQLRDVDALVDVLAHADATTVERAVSAVSALPRVDACADVDALMSELPPPSDPAVARAVEQAREEIAGARALELGGRVDEALAIARSLETRAVELAYAPLEAEVGGFLGSLQSMSGHYDEAAETLAHAHATAIASGHDRAAAPAARLLVVVHGMRRERLDLALQWAEIAEAELVRAHMPEERPALVAAKAGAYRTAGKPREAEPLMREAVEMIDAAEAPNASTRVDLHNNLGDLLRELGDLDAAEAELRLATELGRDVFGPEHPEVAMPLNNLGLCALARREPQLAEERFREVLALRERTLAPTHPLVVATLNNLGVALRRQNRLDEAHDVYVRALGLLGEDDDPSSTRATLLSSIGLVLTEQGRHDDAVVRFDEAIAEWERRGPEGHPDLGRVLHNRAIALLRRGDRAAAMSGFARAIALLQAAYGDDSSMVAYARFDFARVLAGAGADAQATTLASEALAQLHDEGDPGLRADIEAWLDDVQG